MYHQRSHTLKERVLSRRNVYDEYWALKDVDLDVPVGSTLGIIGANGSGKSTLLKTMAKILTPNRGSVVVNGTLASLLELGTGFHPELTGRENVFLGGSLLGHSRRNMESLYDGIVEFADIASFMDIPVKNYSSGMYARLAFAVAISVEPEILLIDEVLSVGDESFQLRCYERMSELRSDGRTVVLVSHSLETIRNLCANAVWIDEGAIREAGKTADVLAAYLTEVHGHVGHEPVSKGGTRYGTGAAEIAGVEFLDGGGEPTAVFRSGEPLTIRLRYVSSERIHDAAFGIAVFRADNLVYLLGQNSSVAGLTLDLDGEGVVDFTIESLPLLRGNHVVSISLHDRAMQHMYDVHDRLYSFIVVDNPALPYEGGLVHAAARWTCSSSTVPV